jgi:lipoate-protein ligase A
MGLREPVGRWQPGFELRENDYVFGSLKFGGNAQSKVFGACADMRSMAQRRYSWAAYPGIVKDRWLHHTSFLWDFHERNMTYLKVSTRAMGSEISPS